MLAITLLGTAVVAALNSHAVGRVIASLLDYTPALCPDQHHVMVRHFDFSAVVLAPLGEETLFRGGLSYTLFKLFTYKIKNERNTRAGVDNAARTAMLLIPLLVLAAAAYIIKTDAVTLITAPLLTVSLLGVRLHMERSKKRFALLVLLMSVQTLFFAHVHTGLYCGHTPSLLEGFVLTLPQFIGGVFLAVLAWRYGLRMSVPAHALNNLIATYPW